MSAAMKKRSEKEIALLTRYSLINFPILVGTFLVSSLVLYLSTKVILIREMDGDLGGIEQNIRSYVIHHDALPDLYPLDEEKISFKPTGRQQTERSFELLQMYSNREKKMHNFRKLEFPLFFHDAWYQVSVAKPLEGMRHLSSALINISLITILLTILLSIVINRLVLQRLWKPFYAAMNVMRNFKLGKTESPVFPATKIREFAFMNKSLLEATEKAEQDYLLLKEFTENASHEIQTPLSIIRSKLDMMIQESDLSRSQSELAKGAYSAVKKLSRLNQSLLLLAKIENGQFDNSHQIDLREKVEEKIAQFHELWGSRDIRSSHRLQDSRLLISPELLDVLLNNLFSNATNHNIPSGAISIMLEQQQLIISNTSATGPLDKKRLFRRFYKESVNSNHNGLGLSIVKQISKVSSIHTDYAYTDGLHYFMLSW